MSSKSKRVWLAFCLCAALAGSSLSGFCPAAKAAQAAVAANPSEIDYLTGSLNEHEVFEITDENLIGRIPSYDDGISLLGTSECMFEQGAGDYGYNSLTDEQKAFYSTIQSSFRVFENSDTHEFTAGSGASYPFLLKCKSDDGSLDISLEMAKQAYLAFLADHPGLFWIQNGYAASEGTIPKIYPIVADDYVAGWNKVTDAYSDMQTKISEYKNAVKDVKNIYEKIRIIHDKIIDGINYAYKANGTTPEDTSWAHSIVGVFDSTHNAAVCEGYAKAFSFLTNTLDIPSVYIEGIAAGGGHAWNAVSFDGGDEYYYMDLTWDDQGGKSSSIVDNTYLNFAMPSENFEKRHTANTPNNSGTTWQYALPGMGNDIYYTYFYRYGTFVKAGEVTTENADEFLRKARTLAPGEKCLMLLPDANTMTALYKISGPDASTGYVPAEDYGDMMLWADEADYFRPSSPEKNFSLSDTELTGAINETKELKISDATYICDDYITFYSSDMKVAQVSPETPYVISEENEAVTIHLKGKGTAVIYAESVAGKVIKECKVTVTDDASSSSSPTPTPPTASTSPSTETTTPTGSTSQAPSGTATATTSQAPGSAQPPAVNPSNTAAPTNTTSAAPTGATSAAPTDTSSAAPTDTSAAPTDTSAAPTDTSAAPTDTSAAPTDTSSPAPTDTATVTPSDNPTADTTPTVVTNPDGSSAETTVNTTENASGSKVTQTVVVSRDKDGNITGSTEKAIIDTGSKDTVSVVVNTSKNKDGNVTKSTATVTANGNVSGSAVKCIVSGDVTKQIVEAAGTGKVTVTIVVKNADGKQAYKVTADTTDLKAGKTLYIVQEKKNGEKVLVNGNKYKVSDNGNVSVAMTKNATYKLINNSEMSKLNKEILKTVKPKKPSKSIKKNAATKMEMSGSLNKANVKSIKYTTSKKSVATVSKTGVVKAKKKGTVTIKAKVTLKSGKTKTVSMKVKVK